jgi:hypothetical protein
MGGRLGAWGIQISGVSPIVALEDDYEKYPGSYNNNRE